MVEYVLPLSADAELLIQHEVVKGKVQRFVVQLTIQGKPVIRYDGAHGFAHIDRYNLKGKQKKQSLNLDFNRALTQGEHDLKQNWQRYRERFLEGRYP